MSYPKDLYKYERIKDQILEAYHKKNMTYRDLVNLFRSKGEKMDLCKIHAIMKSLGIKTSCSYGQKKSWRKRRQKQKEHYRRIKMEKPEMENELKEKLKKVDVSLKGLIKERSDKAKQLTKEYAVKTKDLRKQKKIIEDMLKNFKEID